MKSYYNKTSHSSFNSFNEYFNGLKYDVSCTNAFTLAEVLITLGIIGIIAALTIPALIAEFQEKQTVSQFKKTYSLISQVYSQVVQDNGSPNTWSITSEDDVAAYFIPYFNTTKTCQNTSQNCYSLMGYINANPTDLRKKFANRASSQIRLQDGTILSFESQLSLASGTTCTAWYGYCFNITADINGVKPPNRHGVDVFTFEAFSTKIKPRGASQTTSTNGDLCNPTGDTGSAGWFNGSSCGAWVLQNENTDYLKCIDGGQTDYCKTY